MANLSNINNKFLVTTGGNVGIGTTSPTSLLHLQSASSPSIRLVDTTNTNILLVYAQNSDSHIGTYSNHPLVFDTNSTERMRIDSSGNVIQAATHIIKNAFSDSSGLKLSQESSDESRIFNHFSGPLTFGTANTERMRIDSSGVVKISNTGDAILTITSGTTNTAKINFGDSSNDDAGIIAYTNDAGGSDTMAFTVGTSEKMRIINSGNVGIGTTSPSAKLNIAGDVLINSGEYISWGTVGATSIEGSTASNKIQFRTGSADRMIINNTGVGIGTTSPSSKLHVVGANNTTAVKIDFPSADFDFSANSTSGYTTKFHMDNTGTYIGSNSAGRALIFQTNDTDRLYINGNTGNVGIGTTSPGYKLHVSGTGGTRMSITNTDTNWAALQIQATGNQADYIFFKDDTEERARIAALDSNDLVFYNTDSTTERMRINSSGNVGIGTASPSVGVPLTVYYNSTSQFHIGGVQAGISNNVYYNGSAYVNRNTSTGGALLQLGTDGSFAFRRATSGSSPTLNYSQYIGANGNVGIGTTSPDEKLDITGGYLKFNGGDYGLKGSASLSYNPVSDHYFQSSGSTKVTFKASGNVGIGTTSPDITGFGWNVLSIVGGTTAGSAGVLELGAPSTDANNQNYGIIAFMGGTGRNAQIASNRDAATNDGRLSFWTSPGAGGIVERMRIDSGGSIIIGAGGTSGTPSADYRSLEIGRQGNTITGAPWKSNLYLSCNATITGGSSAFTYRYASEAPARMDLEDGNVTFYNAAAGTAGNTISWNTRMIINSSGNVGIGTTSPAAALQIRANSANGGYTSSNWSKYIFLDAETTGGGGIIWTKQTSTYNRAILNNQGKMELGRSTANDSSGAWLQDLVIDASGNTGIGTGSPASKFEVYGGNSGVNDVDRYIRFKASNGEKRFDFYVGGTGNASSLGMYTSDGTTKNVQISAGGTSYFNAGNVGIGTTAPTYKLHVASSNNVSIFEDTSDASGAAFIVFNRPSVFSMGSITRNGSANSVSYNTGSDYRLKEDLKDFNALDLVNNITAYDYKWKNTEQRDYGFVAHELQQTLPNVVTGEKDGEKMQGVDYSKLTPILLKAIQELKAEIEILKNK
jgi:hypothetical protein